MELQSIAYGKPCEVDAQEKRTTDMNHTAAEESKCAKNGTRLRTFTKTWGAGICPVLLSTELILTVTTAKKL